LRRNYAKSGVAVYLLTSSDDPEHKRQAEADGVTEYLIKSPVVKGLVEKLDLLIAKINADQGAEPSVGERKTANQGLASFPPAETFSRPGPSSNK
jgi:PleD family two-component response regulator